ncbi:MAG: DUF4178 domain-containing protein [Bryobacteraceae bacterium]|nr:DUF4178 domain-containing protein [Bryobacteraceae bacterium]
MQAPAQKPAVRAFACPNCGGGMELRGFQHTRSAVCIQCLSVLDTSDEKIKILQKFDNRQRVRPIIPLGTRGKLHGTVYEVIGFMVRTITVEGTQYSWHEYLLFNPYKGFRYLTTYEGHWNDVVPCHGLPAAATAGGRKAAKYLDRTYKHFQNAMAETTFVMGEFPWAVKVGEKVENDDYVSPPYILSAERDNKEVNWSHGTYMTGAEVWSHFNLPGQPPPASGVFANQPSPHQGRVGRIWKTTLVWLAIWFVAVVFFGISAQNKLVFDQAYRFEPRTAERSEASFVTPVFELSGRTSGVDVEIRTDLANNWAVFHLALINEETGQGFDFGQDVSFYSGVDSDGSWTEGSRSESVTIPKVPSGRYYLRVEPEADASAPAVRYQLQVRRDAPHVGWLMLVLPFLLIPPIVVSLRSASFEGARWAESDYAPSSD